MQIREITEGLLSNVARGFAKGLTGVNFDSNRQTAGPAATADATLSTTAPASATPKSIEKITVSLAQPGQTVPAQYFRTDNVWTNELGQTIFNPRTIDYLNKMIPTHGRRQFIVAPQLSEPVGRRKLRRRTVKKS